MSELWQRWRNPPNEDKWMVEFTIHKTPNGFLIRRWKVREERALPTRAGVRVVSDLDEARRYVPPGKIRFDGSIHVNDKTILETWI